MARQLPGWIFMIFGAVMIFYSNFIERRADTNLVAFHWIGWFLIAWGFIREINTRVLRKKKAPSPLAKPPKRFKRENDHRHPAGNQFHGKSNHETHTHTKPHGHQHSSHPHQTPHKQCPRCHAYNPLHQKNCTKCSHQFY